MIGTQILEGLKKDFNNRIGFRDRGTEHLQLIAPFYHEDGDMYDLFIEEEGGEYRVCDLGHTLMRLSYSYDLDTPKKEEILFRILNENGVENDNGNLFILSGTSGLYAAVLRFTQVVAKVTNMSLFKREVVRNLFYDDLAEFIQGTLSSYNPVKSFLPLPDRDDLEVDVCFSLGRKPLYLFGVKDGAKARLVTICCLEYIRNNIPFRSLVVHEDFDDLSAKDRKIITNVVDKQFTNLGDFRAGAERYLARETA